MRRLAIALCLMVAASPALAQDRSPAIRQSLVDLAYVLGESHALRQVCTGPDDQYWRDRMMRLTETERPDAALDTRLKDSFNTGYASRQSEFPACTTASKRAQVVAADHGHDIAARLSRVMNKTEPEPPTPTILESLTLGTPVAATPQKR